MPVFTIKSGPMNRKVLAGIFVIAIIGLFAFRNISDGFVMKRSFTEAPTGSVYIIVDKSDYELQIYDEVGWYATYPVVFGRKSLEDKMVEGDRKTPEGTFRILDKRPHQKWHKIMMLDYPTQESWQKFNHRKAQGVIAKRR